MKPHETGTKAARRGRALPSLATSFAVFGFVLAGFVALGACSNQGEGERCDALNGNDDCTDNLICYPATQLTNTASDRCCPLDRSSASAPVCVTPVDIVGEGGTAPADTGPPVTADSSASTDAGAGSDAAADAPVSDAATDG